MKYMLLIYDLRPGDPSPEDTPAYMAIAQAPGTVGGAQLQPPATATTVRVQDGRTLTTDGPFAETKEQLGGYYLIEAETLDDALAWAAKIPSARIGSIEVRPVMVFDRAEAPA